MRLSYKYRLYPTKAQGAALTGMLGAFCDLYNAALDQRIQAYRRRGVALRYGQQAGELKAVRATDERLAACGTAAAKTLARREHRCGCEGVLDRDVAAARIVLQRASFSPGTGLRARSEPVAAWLAREAACFSWRSVHSVVGTDIRRPDGAAPDVPRRAPASQTDRAKS